MKKMNMSLVAMMVFFFSQMLFAESSEYVVVGKILYQKVSPTQQGATTLRLEVLSGVQKIFDENKSILLVQGEGGQGFIVDKATKKIQEVGENVARGSISPLKQSVLIQTKSGEICLIGIDTGLIANVGTGNFSGFSPDGTKIIYSKRKSVASPNQKDSQEVVIYDIAEERESTMSVKNAASPF
ncbi:MAG: hypothetical protein AAB552_02820 [Patescibacteria group bacterium]